MSKPKPTKSASQLQNEMLTDIAKTDKKYLPLITKRGKEISKIKAQHAKEKSQIEKKYLAMIEQLDEIDIPFSKADINTDNLGDYR